jgi:hypothetical protein
MRMYRDGTFETTLKAFRMPDCIIAEIKADYEKTYEFKSTGKPFNAAHYKKLHIKDHSIAKLKTWCARQRVCYGMEAAVGVITADHRAIWMTKDGLFHVYDIRAGLLTYSSTQPMTEFAEKHYSLDMYVDPTDANAVLLQNEEAVYRISGLTQK